MIGVVGPEGTIETVVEPLNDGAVDLHAGSVTSVLANDPHVVVAIGEPAVAQLVREGVSVPVLPVDTGLGLPAISLTELADAVSRVADGVEEVRSFPLLEVRIDGTRQARALFDAMLVTTEPARISEFAVANGTSIDRFRADGVVVASPVGSYGYARRAGGPTIDPNTRAAVVVPISAFATHIDQWVVDPTPPIEITIERNEGDISLLVDDEDAGTIPHYTPIEFTFAPEQQFEVAIVEASEPRLEKL